MRHLVSFCAGVLSCALLTGCGIGPAAPSDLTSQGGAIHGVSYGGRAPISGQRVYLLEAVSTGFYASGTTHKASKSLLTTGAGSDSIGYYVLSDANGNWSIGGDYTCDANAQAYIYALGGDSGSGMNTGIGLMAALGPCPSSGPFNFATSDPFVLMNEVTTVAAAYAMAGYATDALHVSSNNTSLGIQGMANAFANAGSLATVSNGTANSYVPGNQSNSVAPQQEINTLGNILAACVNSSTGSANCTTLFSNAESAGSSGTEPTDTATAAINIAHNPGTVNMTNLYGLQVGTGAPYPTDLTTQPNDFTVAITFTGGGLDQPSSIAVDASGNVWMTNQSSLSEFSNSGAAISGSGGFTGGGINVPESISIDGLGNAWVANAGNGSVSVSEFSGNGTPTNSYTGGGINAPFAMAIDGSNNVWTANENTTVSEISNTGTAISGGGGYSGDGLNGTSSIAIDIAGNAWLCNNGGNSISEFASGGSPDTSSGGYTGGGLNQPQSIAIDAAGNIWATNFSFPSSVSELSSNGTAISGGSGYTGGGIDFPYGIAIDGAGNAWVTNEGNNSVSEFSNTGSAISSSTGYLVPGLTNVYSIAIDGSGNAWVVSQSNSVTEFVGAATPVVTPVVANLQSPYRTAAVNIP